MPKAAPPKLKSTSHALAGLVLTVVDDQWWLGRVQLHVVAVQPPAHESLNSG